MNNKLITALSIFVITSACAMDNSHRPLSLQELARLRQSREAHQVHFPEDRPSLEQFAMTDDEIELQQALLASLAQEITNQGSSQSKPGKEEITEDEPQKIDNDEAIARMLQAEEWKPRQAIQFKHVTHNPLISQNNTSEKSFGQTIAAPFAHKAIVQIKAASLHKTCGIAALSNAGALQQLVQEGRPVNNVSVGAKASAIACRHSQSHELSGQEIVTLARQNNLKYAALIALDPSFQRHIYLLDPQLNAIVESRLPNGLHSQERSSLYNLIALDVLAEFARNKIKDPHASVVIPCIANTSFTEQSGDGGHWIVMALLKHAQSKPHIIVLDSSNGSMIPGSAASVLALDLHKKFLE